ncbi:WD40 repeat-like protein [Leucogyrophana mollusca]|uniref:WD40 repeat-like protein n=1 Tax=Leucogyrophana mollusca TaxID=85980 RepID=A0ACB8BJK4_9AGAM|nr:WD40 repeat-like protein [Leucogyrophana mollusca]
MFNNATNVDASNSTFSEVHRDQYNTTKTVVHGNQSHHTIIHGNQVFQNSNEGLEALRKASITSAAFDSAERYPAPTCLPGTRVELLNRISSWIEKEGGQPICWLNGLAGSGKSAIAQRVAEMYAEQHRLAASFFFSRRELERSTTQHFFPTIASQVMGFFPSTKPVILAALDDDYTTPTKVLREQMQKLLLAPLCAIEEKFTSPILIVVDSLDECDNEQLVAELISLLTQLLRQCPHPFRLLLTSRVESHIRDKFREPEIAPMIYSLELRAFDAEEDIRSFMAHTFDVIYDQHSQVMGDVERPWPPTQELESLVKKASGLFIFATTVVKFVASRHHDPRSRLRVVFSDKTGNVGDATFADLDSLYLDAIRALPDADLARVVLGIVRYISGPLSIRSLNSLLSPLDINAALVLPDLSSVLLVSEDEKQPVRIYHASFRDFLTTPQRSKRYFVDAPVYHRLLARLCLEFMTGHLKRDMCSIGDPSTFNSEVKDLPERCDQHIDEATRYACRHWAYHLGQIPHEGGANDNLINVLLTFSRTSILYWVETLSLIGALDSAVTMLRDAIIWLKLMPTPPTDVLALLKDTQRLVLMFFDPISQSALHVYYTALPLAPTNTLLRKEFQHELTNSFTVTKGLDSEWDGCVRVIHLGDSIHSLAFSPDGRLVASASNEHGVQLWNATTGTNVVDLGPHRQPSSAVCFSPSGACIAAAFEDGLVAVWETLTGQALINNEESHRKPVTSIMFSPNNNLLASASRDNSIQLWEVATGQVLHRFEHQSAVQTLAFSPDNKIVVSGSDDGLCTIWDVESGRLLRALKGHSSVVNSVAVSGDSLLIASGSNDKTVRVWDAKTGVCTRTYSKGHKKGVTTVRFTPDDERVISICDKYVGSWNLSSRKSFDPLWATDEFIRKAMTTLPSWLGKTFRLVPSRLVGYMYDSDTPEGDARIRPGFSSRSTSFAFAFRKIIVCATSLAPIHHEPPAFYSMSTDVTSMAVSSDGSQIASGNAQGAIQLWDPVLAMKTWAQVVSYYNTRVHYIKPAPDGKRYLFCQLDMILVGADGEVIKKVATFQTSDVECIFSADSSTFACWAEDNFSFKDTMNVRVYSSATGDRLCRITGIDKIESVALSNDGALIACAHNEGVVQIWQVSSGLSALKIATETVSSVTFSPDRSRLVCGTAGGKVQLWDVQTGHSLASLDDGTSKVTSVVFSPDGNRIVFGCDDGSMRLWSPPPVGVHHTLTSGNEPSPSPVAALVFSRDGAAINCRYADGTVTVWKLPTELPTVKCESEPTSSSTSCEICQAISSCVSTAGNPHLKSKSDKTTVYDHQFRSDYVVQSDGWVCFGERRLFWLPPPLRPSTPTSFMAYGDKLAVVGISSSVMFFDLYRREKNAAV